MFYAYYLIPLEYPLLIAKAPIGLVCCGYLNMNTFAGTGEAAAMVTGVNTIEEMLKAKIVAVSPAAEKLGVFVGDTGEQALQKFQEPK